METSTVHVANAIAPRHRPFAIGPSAKDEKEKPVQIPSTPLRNVYFIFRITFYLQSIFEPSFAHDEPWQSECKVSGKINVANENTCDELKVWSNLNNKWKSRWK